MLIHTIKTAFQRWWDKMGFSSLSSFVGALNPIFLFTVVLFTWVLIEKDKSVVFQNFESIAFWLPIQFATVAVFPLTYAIIGVQKDVFESDVIYLKDYFKSYWKNLKAAFLRSSLLFLIFGAASFLISFAANYYLRIFTIPAVQIGAGIFLFWVYLFVIFSQFVLIPIMLYNPEFKIREAIRYSFRFIMAEGFTILVVVLVDFLILLFCTVTIVFSVVFYLGISSALRIYLHKAIVKKYSEQKPSEDESPSGESMTQAWADIMRKGRDRDDTEEK